MFLQVYSQVDCALQTHSPGHFTGAVVSLQSQVVWQGPASVAGPHERNKAAARPINASREGPQAPSARAGSRVMPAEYRPCALK